MIKSGFSGTPSDRDLNICHLKLCNQWKEDEIMVRKCFTLFTAVFLVFTLMTVGTAKLSMAQSHPEVDLKLLAMPVGGTVYVLSFALAEILKKHHSWLRIQPMEARGSMGNLKVLSEQPAARKDTVFFTTEVSNVYAREAKKPFDKPYKGARAIAAITSSTMALATLDKNIKTKEDLAGKRLMTLRPGTTAAVCHKALISDIWGLGDKVKISHGDFGPIRDALKDGLVDLGAQPINGFPGTFFGPIPTLTDLMATKDVYFFKVSAESVRQIAKVTGLPVFPASVPAGAIGPKQTEPIENFGFSISWWADQEMDPELVYEFTKAVYDYADKFQEYAGAQGKFITRNKLGSIQVPEELFHPGAVKFYKEKGIKVGAD